MADGGDQDTLSEGRPNQNPADVPKYGDPEEDGYENLLTLPAPKAAAFNYKLWKSQPRESRQRRRAEWKVNKWRRAGRSNVYVQKMQDKNLWQAWEPPFTGPPIPVLNKSDRLCRRLKNMSFADPPVPEATPSTDEDADIEAARLEERILKDIQSEANLDDIRAHRRAFDRASTYGSGFIRYYIDDRGGGRQPLRIMAKRGAVSAEEPFLGPDGAPLDGEPVARYVTQDGTLQDTPQGAATQWMPSLKREILLAPQIRFHPHDADDIWDAHGITIGTMPTWGELESLWPDEVGKITKEQQSKLFSFKPEQVGDLLGLDQKAKQDAKDETRLRDRRVACFTTYFKACPLYAKGCYIVTLGDSIVLYRGDWYYEPEDGDPEVMEIPLTQHIQFDDSEPGNPFHLGLMHLLGNGHEYRALGVGHLVQFLDQFAGRRTFVPTNSIIQPKQLQLMAGATIPMNPGGKPEYEQIPDFPPEPMELFQVVSEEMDDHAMMKETAQGTEVSSVTSGRQAAIITQNAMASLSEIRQNIERAYIRACRIQAQQIRTGYTIPQQISWTGEDGAHHQKWWSGSDLRGTADFQLKQGSLSMMTPEQKMNMAIQFQQLGVYNQYPDLFYDAMTSTLGPVVGLQEDPSRVRIKRQLASWSNGPPEDFMARQAAQQAAALQAQQLGGAPAPAPGPPDAVGGLGLPGQPGGGLVPGPAAPAGPPLDQLGSGQPGMAGAQPPALGGGPPAPGGPQPPLGPGQPAPGPAGPPPVDPALASIFDTVEADEMPDVAEIRLTELKRFMASTRYTRWPPEWRQGVVQEFQHMKLCAGIQTVPEQQQAAAEQAQQQQQQADQQFQQQIQLEEVKANAHQNGNGAGGEIDLKIHRDPTGRLSRLTTKGPPPPSN